MVYWVLAVISIVIFIVNLVVVLKTEKRQKMNSPTDINDFSLGFSFIEKLSMGLVTFSLFMSMVFVLLALKPSWDNTQWWCFVALIVIACITQCGIMSFYWGKVVVKGDEVTFRKWYKKDMKISFSDITKIVEYRTGRGGHFKTYKVYVGDKQIFRMTEELNSKIFLKKAYMCDIKIQIIDSKW